MDLNLFDSTLDKWAAAEEAAAEKAKSIGDERAHSIALMKKSMYTTMLKTLGRNHPQALKGCAADLEKRRAKQLSLGDEDAADRISRQLACIRQVQDLIIELGGTV